MPYVMYFLGLRKVRKVRKQGISRKILSDQLTRLIDDLADFLNNIGK